MDEKKLAEINKHFEECYDVTIMAEIDQYVVDRVGEWTGAYCEIMNDITSACLFFSGHIGYADSVLQLLMNIGGFYHGKMAKTVYEYVLSFSVLPQSGFPSTYEEFRSEAQSFGIEFLD